MLYNPAITAKCLWYRMLNEIAAYNGINFPKLYKNSGKVIPIIYIQAVLSWDQLSKVWNK